MHQESWKALPCQVPWGSPFPEISLFPYRSGLLELMIFLGDSSFDTWSLRPAGCDSVEMQENGIFFESDAPYNKHSSLGLGADRNGRKVE